MNFLWVILLPMVLAQGSVEVIESCQNLKLTIEAASAPSTLSLQLRGQALYHCKESIHVGEAQSVVITGGGSGLSKVLVSLLGLPPTAKPSLFVNEGSLKLSNISVELHTAPDEVVRGARGGNRRSLHQEKERQPACAGVGLVWNSGHAVVQDSHVFESGLSISQRRCGKENARQGRVVSVCRESKGKGPRHASVV